MCVIGSYNDQEFVRIGYYVNNEYSIPYDIENPPNPVDVNLLFRSILADQPRVTRFAIHWTAADAAAALALAASSSASSSSLIGADGTVGSAIGEGEGDDDVVDMDFEEEGEDEEDDEEDEDDGTEIDIEAEEDMSNDEEEDGEDEDEVDVAETGENVALMGDYSENAAVDPSNVILCEDSMDVYHMQQIAMEGSHITTHSF